jgi:hypothetical protein
MAPASRSSSGTSVLPHPEKRQGAGINGNLLKR